LKPLRYLFDNVILLHSKSCGNNILLANEYTMNQLLLIDKV